MNHSMYHKKHSKGKVVGLSALLIAVFIAYDAISAFQASAVDVPPEQSALLNDQLLQAFSKIQAIKIDTDFLQDKTFSSLQDFSAVLIPQPVGRPNPFAPLGNQASAPTTGTARGR